MADKYHYDSNGRYTGKTSDTPPGSGCGGIILVLIILFAIVKCSGGDSSPNNSAPAPVEQQTVTPTDPAQDITQPEGPASDTPPPETLQVAPNENPPESDVVVPKEE
jgi:hypothetical protein